MALPSVQKIKDNAVLYVLLLVIGALLSVIAWGGKGYIKHQEQIFTNMCTADSLQNLKLDSILDVLDYKHYIDTLQTMSILNLEDNVDDLDDRVKVLEER